MRKPRVEAAADFLNANGLKVRYDGGKWRISEDGSLFLVILAVEIIRRATEMGWEG